MANYDDIMGGNETQRPETAATTDADELLGDSKKRISNGTEPDSNKRLKHLVVSIIRV
jgi:hypothetical protein